MVFPPSRMETMISVKRAWMKFSDTSRHYGIGNRIPRLFRLIVDGRRERPRCSRAWMPALFRSRAARCADRRKVRFERPTSRRCNRRIPRLRAGSLARHVGCCSFFPKPCSIYSAFFSFIQMNCSLFSTMKEAHLPISWLRKKEIHFRLKELGKSTRCFQTF